MKKAKREQMTEDEKTDAISIASIVIAVMAALVTLLQLLVTNRPQ